MRSDVVEARLDAAHTDRPAHRRSVRGQPSGPVLPVSRTWHRPRHRLTGNHFHFLNPDPTVVKRANDLRRAIASVNLVVACSTYLRDVIANEVPAPRPIRVIGDFVEHPSLSSVKERTIHPLSWLRWQKLNHELTRTNDDIRKRLVWFGNHGSICVEGGMRDIRKLLPILREAHRRRLLRRTVVSNSRTTFEAVSEGAGVPLL